MVIPDSQIDINPQIANEDSQALLLASPIDRVAAFVIDHLILLGPIINLFAAPFERQMKEAIMLGDDPQTMLSILHAVLMGLSVVVIYHTVFTSLVGASVGQILMGLRVLNLKNRKPLDLWNSLLRCALWIGNFLLLGIPTLAVFSDHQRRTWYDRASDSIVVTTRSARAAIVPRVFHKSVVQGFIASISAFGVIILALTFYSEVRDYDHKAKIYSMLEEDDVLCEVVGEAQADWPKERGKKAGRVSVALSLYLAGEVDLSCLEAEFDERTLVSQQDELARLAKTFIYQEHEELSDLYLNTVCDSNSASDACEIAKTLLSPAAGLVAVSHVDDAPVYLQVWALKQNLTNGKYKEAQVALEHLPKTSWTAGLRSVSLAKIDWGTGQFDKARGSTEVALDYVNASDRTELASWMCLSELSRDCDTWDSVSCLEFQDAVKANAKSLETVTASLAQVKKRNCEEDGPINYIGLLKQRLHEDVANLVRAQADENRADILSMAEDLNLNPQIRTEAAAYLLNHDPKDEELAAAEKIYLDQSLPMFEPIAAPLLVAYANETRDFEKVVRFAKQLENRGIPLPAKMLENYIVAEFHLGRKIRASELLTAYQKSYPENWYESLKEDRTPASVEDADPEFALVARSLK